MNVLTSDLCVGREHVLCPVESELRTCWRYQVLSQIARTVLHLDTVAGRRPPYAYRLGRATGLFNVAFRLERWIHRSSLSSALAARSDDDLSDCLLRSGRSSPEPVVRAIQIRRNDELLGGAAALPSLRSSQLQ